MKTGQWYHGGMAKPVQLDVDTGSDTSSIRADPSPPHEKKPKFYERGAISQSQERMLMMHAGEQGGLGPGGPGLQHGGPPPGPMGGGGGPAGGPPGPPGPGRQAHPGMVQRAGSLHGKELKRQFSMSEVNKDNSRTAGGPPGAHHGPPPGGGGGGPSGPPLDPRERDRAAIAAAEAAMMGRDGGGRGRDGRGGLRDHSRGRGGEMDHYGGPGGGVGPLPPDGSTRGPPYDGMDPRDVGGGGYPPGDRRPDMMAGGEMYAHDPRGVGHDGGMPPHPGDERMRGGPRYDGQDPMRRREDGRPR